jgi:hypothetical protein
MSVWKNPFLLTPREFQARIKKTQALCGGNEFPVRYCGTVASARLIDGIAA